MWFKFLDWDCQCATALQLQLQFGIIYEETFARIQTYLGKNVLVSPTDKQTKRSWGQGPDDRGLGGKPTSREPGLTLPVTYRQADKEELGTGTR